MFTLEQQKANRKLWFKKLEETELKQGKGALCTRNNEYCCLGIACEVAIENGLLIEKWMDEKYSDNVHLYGKRNEDISSAYLPSIVSDWLGMKTIEGAPVNEPMSLSKVDDSCAIMNDEGLSFKEIAQRLQKHESAYFLV